MSNFSVLGLLKNMFSRASVELTLTAPEMWPPSYSYSKRQSTTMSSSYSSLYWPSITLQSVALSMRLKVSSLLVKQGSIDFSPGESLMGDSSVPFVRTFRFIRSSGLSNILKVLLIFPLGRWNLWRLSGAIGDPSRLVFVGPASLGNPLDLDFEDTSESGAPNSLLLNSFCFLGGGEHANISSNLAEDTVGDFRGEQANKPSNLVEDTAGDFRGEQANKSSNLVADTAGDLRGEEANKSSNLAEDTVGDLPKRLDVERPERALALIALKEVLRLLCFRREGLVKLDDFLRLKIQY